MKIAAGTLKVLSSSKLALALVVLLILFSLAGALLPQEGMFGPLDISRWQEQHSTITALAKPAGFFRVFHSIPFLVTIFLLAVNILTCTVQRFIKEGGISSLKGKGAVCQIGFLILHLSLIGIFAGGLMSVSASLDGYILLTEGQGIEEKHDSYLRLVEGPFRKEHHRRFVVRLKKVRIEYQKKQYLTGITSQLEILENREKVREGTVKVNYPFTYRGLDFTHDKTGFSPRLVIRERSNRRPLVNSFIALKTFRRGQVEREYRDFLPLPFFKQKVIVTLYPNHTRVDGQVKKIGEEPENPILLVETEDETGKKVSRGEIPLGGSLVLGNYLLGFAELRRWTSFRVMDDPGYPVVWIALWVGIAGFIMRYIPDLRKWFGHAPVADKVNHEGHEEEEIKT